MSIYDDMRDIASDVFAEFKQGSVSYVDVAATAGARPDLPGVSVETITAINATVRPVSTNYVDGSHIVQSDKQVSMPNDGVTPSIKGFVVIDGARHKIIEVMANPAAGEAVSFTLIVRR